MAGKQSSNCSTFLNMRRQNESLAEILLKAPWWVNVVIGLLAFIGLRWGGIIWEGNDNLRLSVAKGFAGLAWLPLIFFGLLAAGSFWFGRHRRRLVDQTTNLESLRDLPWKQFEILVAEAFRRQGYQVEFFLNRGADGGIDLILKKDGRTSLVQCKQWKVFSVGAPDIREMFGLMTAEGADEAIIVTSGQFTREAESFATGKPIRLLDGPQLLSLVQSVQNAPQNGNSRSVNITSEPTPAPSCPLCGVAMIRRTARRGHNAGNPFWGCPSYPDCKGTRPLAGDAKSLN